MPPPYTYPDAWCLVTYTADDGTAGQAWNARDGQAPDVITLPGGQAAAKTGTLFGGEDWAPPPNLGLLTFTDDPPAVPPPAGETAVHVHWPGTAHGDDGQAGKVPPGQQPREA